MTRLKAIHILLNEKACVESNCDRNCGACSLAKEEAEIIEALNMAIEALWYWRRPVEVDNE